MSQNTQSSNKKNADNVHYKTSIDHPKMKSGELQGENCIEAKRDYQVQVHSGQKMLVIVRQGG
jgi:hypothetical protein